MFAVLIINITQNAGRELAFQRAGIFNVRIHIGTTLYRYPCTPVYRLNGRTAFCGNVMSNGTGTDTFFYLLCYTLPQIPTPQCSAATERPPTKRAPDPHSLLPETLTPTSHAWAWTCRAATSATAARPTRRGTPLPARSTSAARATPWEPRLILSSSKESSPNGRRSKPTTAVAAPRSGCATPSPSSPGIPTPPYFPPTSRNGRNLLLLFSPPNGFPRRAARDGYTLNRTNYQHRISNH